MKIKIITLLIIFLSVVFMTSFSHASDEFNQLNDESGRVVADGFDSEDGSEIRDISKLGAATDYYDPEDGDFHTGTTNQVDNNLGQLDVYDNTADKSRLIDAD